MEILQLLATALGISAMSGINLYLTVFATSLSLNMGWLHLSQDMQALQVLADPIILAVSGMLYFLEFCVDKTPGLDSMWDTVHTAIRPLGAMLMSMALLGQTDTVLEIIVTLLCGGVAFSTHATKAGLRAIINVSPEPFSNAAASIAEDIMVAGGLAVVYTHPLVAGISVLCFMATFVWFAPKLFRFIKMIIIFVRDRLSHGGRQTVGSMPRIDMVPGHREILASSLDKGDVLAWSVKGFTGRSSLFPSGLVCYLLKPEDGRDGDDVTGLFVPARRIWWFDSEKTEMSMKRRFLFDEFMLHDAKENISVILRFSRSNGRRLESLLGLQA